MAKYSAHVASGFLLKSHAWLWLGQSLILAALMLTGVVLINVRDELTAYGESLEGLKPDYVITASQSLTEPEVERLRARILNADAAAVLVPAARKSQNCYVHEFKTQSYDILKEKWKHIWLPYGRHSVQIDFLMFPPVVLQGTLMDKKSGSVIETSVLSMQRDFIELTADMGDIGHSDGHWFFSIDDSLLGPYSLESYSPDSRRRMFFEGEGEDKDVLRSYLAKLVDQHVPFRSGYVFEEGMSIEFQEGASIGDRRSISEVIEDSEIEMLPMIFSDSPSSRLEISNFTFIPAVISESFFSSISDSPDAFKIIRLFCDGMNDYLYVEIRTRFRLDAAAEKRNQLIVSGILPSGVAVDRLLVKSDHIDGAEMARILSDFAKVRITPTQLAEDGSALKRMMVVAGPIAQILFLFLVVVVLSVTFRFIRLIEKNRFILEFHGAKGSQTICICSLIVVACAVLFAFLVILFLWRHHNSNITSFYYPSIPIPFADFMAIAAVVFILWLFSVSVIALKSKTRYSSQW